MIDIRSDHIIGLYRYIPFQQTRNKFIEQQEKLDNSKLGSTQQWMTLTCCQDYILTENIWFVWSETSYSGDERRCNGCGTNERTNDERTLKIELLSQWKLEAEFRNFPPNFSPLLRFFYIILYIFTLEAVLHQTLMIKAWTAPVGIWISWSIFKNKYYIWKTISDCAKTFSKT